MTHGHLRQPMLMTLVTALSVASTTYRYQSMYRVTVLVLRKSHEIFKNITLFKTVYTTVRCPQKDKQYSDNRPTYH